MDSEGFLHISTFVDTLLFNPESSLANPRLRPAGIPSINHFKTATYRKLVESPYRCYASPT